MFRLIKGLRVKQQILRFLPKKPRNQGILFQSFAKIRLLVNEENYYFHGIFLIITCYKFSGIIRYLISRVTV